MSLKNRILSALGQAPRNEYNEIDVRFYKACNNDGQHGMVVVSHRVQRLDHVAVPFLFPGMTVPPALTARVLADIESAGASQGYVVHHLLPETYGPNPVEDSTGAYPSADIERTPFFNHSRPTATLAVRAVAPGYVTEDDINNFSRMWRSRYPTVNAAMMSMSEMEMASLRPMLNARIQRGFERHDVVGEIETDLTDILHDYMSSIGRTVIGGSGMHLMGAESKITLGKLKEGSTLVQIQTAERLINEHFAATELNRMPTELREDLEMRVLLQVNNDTGRKKPQSVMEGNVERVIATFRTLHGIKTA